LHIYDFARLQHGALPFLLAWLGLLSSLAKPTLAAAPPRQDSASNAETGSNEAAEETTMAEPDNDRPLLERSIAVTERARKLTKEATKLADPTQRRLRLNETRMLYQQMELAWQAERDRLRSVLVTMQKSMGLEGGRQWLERREKLRADYLQAQLMGPALTEELADTYEPGEAPRNECLTRAAEAYRELYEKYRTRLAGQYARLYQARCELALDEKTQALEHLEELLELPATPQVFSDLKARVLRLALDCWEEHLSARHVSIVERAEQWRRDAKAAERGQAEYLGICVALARAYELYAGLPSTDPAGRKKYLEQARRLLEEAAAVKSLHQLPAKDLLKQLDNSA
jgi:hypothetical protein